MGKDGKLPRRYKRQFELDDGLSGGVWVIRNALFDLIYFRVFSINYLC